MVYSYYGVIVGLCGVSPEYFWYEMTEEEAEAIFKAKSDDRREKWEQTRLVSYFSATFSKNPPTITKFMPFDWDNEKNIADLKNRPKSTKERMDKIVEMIKQNDDE